MQNFYKGRIFNILAILLAGIFCLFIGGCDDSQRTFGLEDFIGMDEDASFCSVTFVDVGDGDCILIKLPDGKTALIDCGENTDRVYKNVTAKLSQNNVSKIDYFILTHPDVDHIGNATKIIDEYKIENLFVSNIHSLILSDFPSLKSVIDKANLKTIKIISNKIFNEITTSQYFFAFLSPTANIFDKEYNPHEQLLLAPQSPTVINNLSPIIYFECKGVRFLFTGDAGLKQEEFVLNNYNAGYYERSFSNLDKKVNLDGIDFLKVAHHGSADATGKQFLELLLPRYAVVSVGVNGGNPSTATLERIISTANSEILRTDTLGDIVVSIDNKGTVKIK